MGRIASKVLTSILRAAEMVFAIVVLALEVLELQRLRERNPPPAITDFDAVQISTLTIAATSTLVAALFIWGDYTFKYFSLEFILGVAWLIIFGFHIAHFASEPCEQGADQLKAIAFGGACNEKRAIWGFAFLSGLMWLGTFLTGSWVIWRERRQKSQKKTTVTTTYG